MGPNKVDLDLLNVKVNFASNCAFTWLTISPDQRRSQNAVKGSHIKGRLLYLAAIHYNCAPFQNGNFSERKELAPRGSSLWYGKSLLPHKVTSLECYFNVTILLRTCVTA